jgi:multimeric flavodoxin WrbA
MNILAVNGSARKGGNTEIILSHILSGAETCGAKTSFVAIDEMLFSGCKGCLWCQQSGGGNCIQKDDMEPLYEKIAAADAIVIGSPVYFSAMTAQTKMFTDRLYPFYGRGGVPSRLPKKTKLAMVYTQGQPDPEKYLYSFKIAADAFRLIGFDVLDDVLIAPGTPNKGDVLQQAAILEKARTLGKLLCQDIQND